MGAPKGSKNGCGKKGRSGRKSAFEEATKAALLSDTWFGEGVSLEKLEEVYNKIGMKKGKVRLWEVFLMKSIIEKHGHKLDEMFKKLFPDKVLHGEDPEHKFGVVLLPQRSIDGTKNTMETDKEAV